MRGTRRPGARKRGVVGPSGEVGAGGTRAGGGEGGAGGWGGGLSVLDLPPRPSPTADVGVPRAAASPAWIRHCTRASSRSCRRREPTRVGLREEDIAGGNRFHPALAGSSGSPPLGGRAGWGPYAYAASSRP